jgi:hypothetical protein
MNSNKVFFTTESNHMRLLSKLLVSACCWAAVGAQAGVPTQCKFVNGGYVCPPATKTFVYVGTTTIVTQPANNISWGTTEASIFANFASTIYSNFTTNTQLNAMITAADNFMLGRLSTELAAHDTAGYTPLILQAAAAQLSAAQLSRLRSAFGPTLVNAAVAYAPAAVQSAYYATPIATPLPLSQYFYAVTGMPRMAELDSMYMYDLFLDAYTSPGLPGVQTAQATTARYINQNIKVSFIDIIVVVAAVIGIAESKTAANVADWVVEQAADYASYGTSTEAAPFGYHNLGFPGPLMPAGAPGYDFTLDDDGFLEE